MGVNPFYEALLERMLNTNNEKPKFRKTAEKVLETFVIPVGSPIADKTVMEVDWGKHCLIVSVERDGASITPKGETVLKEGDELVILVSQRRFSKDYTRLDALIKG